MGKEGTKPKPSVYVGVSLFIFFIFILFLKDFLVLSFSLFSFLLTFSFPPIFLWIFLPHLLFFFFMLLQLFWNISQQHCCVILVFLN